MSELLKLAPLPMIELVKDEAAAIVAEITMHAAARSPENIMAEVYAAGLWHGCELARAAQSDT